MSSENNLPVSNQHSITAKSLNISTGCTSSIVTVAVGKIYLELATLQQFAFIES